MDGREKRGLLIQFNEYILKHSKNKFKINTINQDILPKIKYVITLDADTELPLNTAFELVGAMAHILNKPELDVNKNIVKKRTCTFTAKSRRKFE